MLAGQEGHITFEWLTPILISAIGAMIWKYLASIEYKIKEVGDKLEKHIDRAEIFIINFNQKHADVDKRISILEARIPLKSE